MQYTRRDWRNRNRIKMPNGLMWLTIPIKVKGKYSQKINETEVQDANWASKHWKTICHAYSNAPFFRDYKDIFENIYERAQGLRLLTDINLLFLTEICRLLHIETEFDRSKKFDLKGDKSEKLLNLCLKLGASVYYSGPAAKDYLNLDKFSEKDVKVNWLDYSKYPEYKQLHGDFVHSVSILDTIFMVGPEAQEFYFT